ncbi:transcription factor FapR [Bacillus cereus]|uniref:transcription factor FapR n=1 Tax=Bacillus cereus TaxID=1396 RepID=UPI000BF848AE|nr:transcription factor FapR [Bacillus cereus]PEW10116.1 fatty acid biosynthesis transcriptional regulator [Bacillus cereus]
MGKKEKRQALLKQTILETPFIKDKELARKFNVSVQTIRLDRSELSIPELRERMKAVADCNMKEEICSLAIEEVTGEIIDLTFNKTATSVLEIKENQHVFSRNQIVRGHYLLAQANSLAEVVTNDELALTCKANIHFLKQVKQNDRVIAKAKVIGVDLKKSRTIVEVQSFVGDTIVLFCEFEIYRTNFNENLKVADRALTSLF